MSKLSLKLLSFAKNLFNGITNQQCAKRASQNKKNCLLLDCDIGGNLKMDGKEVFRKAVRIMVDSAEKSMKHAGVTADDIKLIVPHQANIRIIEVACNRLGVPMERAASTIHRTGNTSSASIPIALADALDAGRVDDGDLVLLVGFGAGMTAASAVLRWGRTTE